MLSFHLFSPDGRVQIATCSFKSREDFETAKAKAVTMGFVVK